MTNLATIHKPDDSTLRFLSFASLRLAHGDLLKLYRETDDKDALVPDIHALIEKGRETGALIDNDDDLLAAQSLLDYWVSVLVRSGHSIDNATLAEFDLSLAPALDDATCPYRGLDAFREQDAGFFYGRQRLVTQLLNALASNPLLAVIGASGSGKSSVVLGGLVPKLKAGALPQSDQWRYFSAMVPGSHPLASLVQLLGHDAKPGPDWVSRQVQQLETNPTFLPTLVRQVAGDTSTVLVIDQFEEVFTLCQDPTLRNAFINNLVALIEGSPSSLLLPAPRDYIILTMRSDFESQVATLPQLWPLFESAQVRVLPLDAGEIREAITAPADQVGLKFEAGVIDQLITDVLGEPAALPLLQFMLLQLWDHRDRNRVTYAAYRQLGGGRGALAHSADEFYTRLIPEDQETARQILLKMVRPGSGLEVTNNRIRRTELYQIGLDPGRIDRVLAKLINARLVRLTPGTTPDDTQIEIAHEALIRNWPRLIEWLDEERVTLRQRLHLADTATQWERRGCPRDMLMKGIILEEAKNYNDLSPLEINFVKSSQRSEIRKSRFRSAALATIILLLSGLSIVLTFALYRQKQLSNIQTKLRTVQEQEQEVRAQTQTAQTQTAQTQTALAQAELAQAELAQLQAQLQAKQATSRITEQNRQQAEATGQNANESAASRYETMGFDALLLGNLSSARQYFGQAYEAFPAYHNVDEIYKQVLSDQIVTTFESSDAAGRGKILREIYQSILQNYAWGAPTDALTQMQTRLSATVEYFPRGTPNEPMIGPDLSQLGFSVTSSDPARNTVPLNALWFSNIVDTNTVKLVAKVLLEQGVQLKSIQPFPETSPNRTANIIQIGGNPDSVNCPVSC